MILVDEPNTLLIFTKREQKINAAARGSSAIACAVEARGNGTVVK